MYRFKKLALGGTFDRLHKGHLSLLEKAATVGEFLVVGLTSDEFVKNKLFSNIVLPYKQRESDLKRALKLVEAKMFEIVMLNDIFGTTLVDEKIDALVVSQKTSPGAEIINAERARQKLPPLPVIQARMIYDDDGDYISSTKIRQGKINRQGEVYLHRLLNGYVPNKKVRELLRRPWGKVYRTLKKFIFNRGNMLAVVGDLSLNLLVRNKVKFDIAVFDGKIAREKHNLDFERKLGKLELVENSCGEISQGLVNALQRAVDKGKGTVKVKGEEDLAVLPLLMMMPLESLIVYGQPNEGIVVLRVEERLKEKWHEILKREC